MQYTFIPQLYGVIKNPHRRLIPENKAADTLNTVFFDGKFARRWGYATLGDNLPLNGIVTAFAWYEQLGTATKYLLAFTTRDSYYYEDTTNIWKYITKQYNTGTTHTTGTTITGTGTTWDNVNWSKTNVYEIKFGTNDANIDSITKTGNTNTSTTVNGLNDVTDLYAGMTITGTDIPAGTTVATIASSTSITISQAATGTHTGLTFTFGCSTWYTVASVGSSTTMTALVPPPVISSSYKVNYVLRLCWSGDLDNRHSVCMPIDNGSRIVVAVNGVDNPQKWTGSNQFIDIGGTPPNAKYCVYFGSVTQERLYFAWTIDTGVNQPQTIELAAINNVDDWSGGIFYDLLNTNDDIKGIKQLSNAVAIYKENNISLAYPNSNEIDPLSINQNIINIGTPSVMSVVDYGKFHIFLGNDYKINVFDGINLTDISYDIGYDLSTQLNQGQVTRSFSMDARNDNLYVLFVPSENDYPDKCFVFNIREKIWSIWKMAHLMTSAGFYKKNESLSWSGLVTSGITWQELYDAGLSWSDFIIYSGDFYPVLGDSLGNVYVYGDVVDKDNTTNITATLETRDYPFGDLKKAKKVLEIIIGAASGLSELQVSCSVDFGATWSDWQTLNLASSASFVEGVVNIIRVGKQARFKFQNLNGSYFEVESIQAGWIEHGINVGR